MDQRKIKLGLIVGLGKEPERTFEEVFDLGFSVCQLTDGVETIRELQPDPRN